MVAMIWQWIWWFLLIQKQSLWCNMQIKITHEIAKEVFKQNPKALEMIAKNLDGFVWVSLMSDEALKSDAQNRLFHGLLSIFWDSGCSSFLSYDELRRYYKKNGWFNRIQI